ncbi:MAG: four helix bundle protein [Nitrospirae bacterium]|nr:four helix bundle protein [Nitrospirota bacterium]
MESYQELEVWKKAIELVTEIYKITKTFPNEEIYALTNQIRRAAISIPANIAEGWGRNMTKEYIQFLRIARGSLLELETHLIVSKNLQYLNSQALEIILQKTQEINKMLNSFL